MPRYEFETVNAAGRRARESESAPSVAALVSDLSSRGLTALDIREGDRGNAPPVRVGRAAVADAARALASLLSAGIPLGRALDIAAAAAPARLAEILRDVRARVERGESVATAMAAHPQAFRPAATGVVRAGERAGDLDGAFDRLAGQLEREEALRARLVSAAIYPAVLAIAGGAAIVVLLLFVLPRFAALLEGTGMPIPRSTAWLLAVAGTLRDNWMLLPAAAAAVIVLVAWLRSATAGRRLVARVLLTAPVIAPFRRAALTATAARSLAVLLHGAAPLPSALEDAAASADDPLLSEALRNARARVLAGSALHAALGAEPVFDDVFISLVATGEEAGRVAEFLERAAGLFEQRTERAAQRLVALAEPAMIVAFGAVVGVIALSLLQAIYGINPAGLR